MDVLCSLVQQDIAEAEKEDREMAAQAQSAPAHSGAAAHHGAHSSRSSQMDPSFYTQQQLASLSRHNSERQGAAGPTLTEMAFSTSPAHGLRHQIFMNQAGPPAQAMGNQLSRQHSAQPSWHQQETGLSWQTNNVRRTISAPNEAARPPLYPSVPSHHSEMEKKNDIVMEKLETAPRRSIKKSAPAQKAKKRRSSLQLPGDVYCRLCGTKETPEWRRGPDGLKSLCNACGIHFARMMRAERKVVAAKEEETRRKASIINIMNH